jgi:hypothetical protein
MASARGSWAGVGEALLLEAVEAGDQQEEASIRSRDNEAGWRE